MSQQEAATRRSQLYHKTLSASIGALITSAVATPLDVVKVRLQSQSAVRSAVAAYGMAMSKPSASLGNLSAEPFIYCNRLFDHVEPIRCYLNAPIPKSTQVPFVGTLEGLMYIIKNEGIASLWRGFVPTLMMAIPATVVYFVGYENLRNHAFWKQESPVWSAVSKPSLIDQYIAPLASGAIARTMAATVISPIELVRTRMQSISYEQQTFSVVLKDMIQMIQKDGLASLWRGLLPTLWRDVPFSAIYWLGYEKTKKQLAAHWSHRLDLQGRYAISDDFMLSFSSGFISGMMAALMTTPFDVAKTRRQIQGLSAAHSSNAAYLSTEKSISKILSMIWAEAGVKGLFRGLSARIVKVAPACAIMISSYEVGKMIFKETG